MLKFELGLYNSFGIQALLDVSNVVGLNERNPSNVKLISSEISEPILLDKAVNSVEFVPDTVQLVLDKSNSNIKQFLENIPDKISPHIDATIRPYGTVNLGDFAFHYSTLDADLKLTVPLKVGFEDFSISSLDDITLFQEEDIESIKEVVLSFRVENSFPITALLSVQLYDEQKEVIMDFVFRRFG